MRFQFRFLFRGWLILFIIGSKVLFPANVSAADNLVINEFSANTSPDWIELYNAGEEPVELSKYQLQDSTSSIFDFSVSTSLNAKSFFVAEVSKRLDQSEDTIKLIVKDTNAVSEEVTYGPKGIAIAPDETQSIAKDKDGNGNFILVSNPTKGSSNCSPSCPTPSPTASPTISPTTTPQATNTPSPSPTNSPSSYYDYSNIILTEIYPSPESGGNEWVEIYNGNDSEANLNGWYIQDNAGAYKEIKDFKIGGKSYAYFAFGSGYLNNVGDTVTLLNHEKQEKSGLPAAYPVLTSSQSWSKVGDDWCMAAPTKGEANPSCLSEADTQNLKQSPTASAKNTATPKSSTKVSPRPEASGSAQDLEKLPVLGAEDSRIDVTDEIEELEKKPLPKLLLPLGIASSGIMLLGGSLTALNKPELITAIIKYITRR